jgi:hypothetical protein
MIDDISILVNRQETLFSMTALHPDGTVLPEGLVRNLEAVQYVLSW